MFGSYHIGRVLGIPIRVHVTLILFLPLIAVQIAGAMGIQSLWWGLLAAIGLFTSVALHELGHSVVALTKGVRVSQILLLPIGGVAQLERMTENPRDEIHIALAGPAVSFVLALIFWILVTLFGGTDPGLVIYTFMVLGWMNFVLAVFNLLPSFPMDGGRVFRAWLTPRVGRVAATRIAAKTGRFMALILGLWGLLPPFSLLTIAVAVFIYLAAGAEYRMVVMQDRMRRPFTDAFGFKPPTPPAGDGTSDAEDEIMVSPPPYARQRPTDTSKEWWHKVLRKQRDMFDRLFQDWSER